MEEVSILNTIDHPYICNYYETYDDTKFIYLVMEYIPGVTVMKKVTNAKKYGEKQAAKYMHQLFEAIAHCHHQKIVHRDIKPDNIMVNEDDDVRLIDFGLALATN
jgi:serine/threonine protein kinase